MNLVLLYGGRSGEHEISLLSGASVLKNLDPKFNIIPVSIDKEGVWRRHDLNKLKNANPKCLAIFVDDPKVTLLRGTAGQARLVDLDGGKELKVDLVFPIVHGPLCEDGSLQGLLELCDVPYVGSGVTASAAGMDKDVAKRLFIAAGIPVADFQVIHKREWIGKKSQCLENLKKQFSNFPIFVKPANMGSSVGVHKVKSLDTLADALSDAFRYDTKVLVEQGLLAREIEVSVLEELDPLLPAFVSKSGEVIPSAKHEFYSYESKYLDPNGAEFEIPAEVTAAQSSLLVQYARKGFAALGCQGYARVDFLVHQTTGEIVLNEINTIPGFTAISMYPKMLEASGISYATTLNRLIDLALRDFGEKQALVRDFHNKSN